MRAMVLAAGRGDRMRPLTNDRPKPLLTVGGKPLIVWQIERLVRGGYDELVINVSYLGQQIVDALGDGHELGARISYSPEAEPLESAGGVAYALPQLVKSGEGPVLVVAADVYTEFDYGSLADVSRRVTAGGKTLAHLVLVPNPAFRPHGDYALHASNGSGPGSGRVSGDGETRWTWSGIGIFHTELLREIPFGQRIALLPFFADWMGRGLVSGELYSGVWDNLGTPEQLRQLDRKLDSMAR